ncbi:hypothetical protein GZH49_01705 [Nocardia terpenica]|uniref:hypothetical protein n=1 Tax=Nocardia terpenica TaxID=455432 RepID=UPI002FDF9D6E
MTTPEDETAATEKIRREPPRPSSGPRPGEFGPADAAAPTEAIRRVAPQQGAVQPTSPMDTNRTEMFQRAVNRSSQDATTVELGTLSNSGPTQQFSSNPAARAANPPAPRPVPPRQPEQTWQLGATPEHPAPQSNSARRPDGSQYPATATYRIPAPDAPPEPAAGAGRTRWILIGTGLAVVVAVATAGAVVALGRHSGGSTSPQAAAPSMVSALTTARSAPPSGRSAPTPNRPATPVPAPNPATMTPLIPGYQVVMVPDRGAAYDIPKDWTIDPVGTALWGNPPDTVDLAGLATDGKNYCPTYTRTHAFLTMSPQADPAAAATDVGQRMARAGWSVAGTPGKAEQVMSLDGQLHGAFVETTGSAPPPAPSCASTFSVYTFAFASENGNFVMTIAADTGVPKAVDKATAKKILASIRPLPDR